MCVYKNVIKRCILLNLRIKVNSISKPVRNIFYIVTNSSGVEKSDCQRNNSSFFSLVIIE